MPGAERGRILSRAADLIEQHAPELSALETAEMGKLYADTVAGDIPAAAASFRHYAGWADKIAGEAMLLPDVGPQHRFGYTLRQPLGVVGAITPWNNPTVVMGNFYHQGQVCAAGTRVIVHESIADQVVEGLVEFARGAVVGDPFDAATTQGTIVNRKQLDRILGYIDKGRAEGAELLTGGVRVGDRGFFVEPTVFRGNNDLTIAREEIFGPVATVITFKTTEEAVRLANTTKYGLNAFIFSQNLSTVHSVIPQLRVGTVWVNGWGVPDPSLPWGGREASGIGRELGRSGLEAFTEEKTVHLGY